MAVSYATNIRPLIRQIDIDNMLFFCDLSNYNDVKTNAAALLSRLNGTGGPVMPPKKNGGPWKPENVALFAQWIADGCQP